MKKTLQSANSRLARRMSISVILASTLIAIFTSGLQIYSEFQRELKGVYAGLEQIEQTHLSSISSRVWVLDERELETTLNSLLSLPSIEFIAAYDNETLFMAVGTDTNDNVVIKNFPLHYEHENKSLQIGKLIVKASLDDVYQHVIDQAVIIILSNAIKTFIVAGLILLIFYRLVARHLNQIGRFAEQLDIDTLDKTFEFDRKKNPPGDQDELDILKTALSNMQRNLAQATQGLQEREQNLAITLHSIGDAVITTDAKGQVTRMNPVAEQLTGWLFDEVKGQSLKSIFPIIDASTCEPIENPVEIVISTGETVYLSNHTTLISKDGTEYQIADSAAPIRDKDGNILGMVLVFNDVTEQYQLRMAAAKSRRNLQAIMDHSPSIIDVKDTEGHFTFINQQFEKMFNVKVEDIIGKTLHDIFPLDIAEGIKRNDIAVLETQQTLESEEVIPQDDGLHSYISNKFPLFDDEDKVYAFCSISTDITERKRAEEIQRENNERFRASFTDAAVGMALVSVDHSIIEANPAFGKMIGYSKDELVGIFFADITHMDDVETGLEYHRKLIAGKVDKYHFEKRYIHKQGHVIWVTLSVSLVRNDDATPLYTIAQIQDITERKRAEEELLKLSRAVEYSPSAIYITDLDGNIEYINPKFTDITGYTKKEAIGENTRLLNSGETPEEVHADLWETITSGEEWKGEFHNRKKDGSLYWARNSISAVKDINGEISHFIAIQDDMTHEYELSEQLGYQASHDTLTRLINRHEFERRAERLLATVVHNKAEHAFCYMDLDQFKVVNDTCGHIAGDELLRQLSAVLMNAVRKRDTLARLGGDEFGVLMEHCSIDDALRAADSILKAIQNYQFSWEGHTFRVGASIGLVAVTDTTLNLTELFKDADAACYMAKDKGRNRIHVYHVEDTEMVERHGEMQWVTRINQALEEDRFCLYAQSILPLDGSNGIHYELLVRMINEKGKIIPPGAFLPAAERYNLIVQLDSWVIEKAFTLLSANPNFLKQIEFISINLSGQSLTDKVFLDFVISKINESGVKGHKICFEITETAAISNLNTATKFISKLKEFGCRFALDDFGSGLSSFAYLKNLPVDYLKIDGMFVKDIVDDPVDHAMVKSINEIGHVMGMKTIAEFVENDEIKGMLREIGVNYAQGYGIDKPKPFDELLERSSNVTDIKEAESDGSDS